MKKLTILFLVLTLALVGCGSTEDKKEVNKKAENVEKVEEKKEVEETEDEEVEVKDETVVDETTTTDTTSQTDKQTANKNTTVNKVTTSKPSSSQPVTQPTGGHVHNWTEVTEVVEVPETGHYEKVAGWVKFCTVCKVNMDDWTAEEIDAHTFGDECPGKYTMDYMNIGEKWVVDTPATTESRVIGYKCSCGATREKTQYAGMYKKLDQASWDRLNACKSFFKEGLAGEGSDLTVWASYGYGRSVTVCNDSTNGAWMWISLTDWKLDDYSYLQDSVKEGIIDQEEAKLVEAIYEEIPSIFKGAIERVAPQGGTELYNYVEKLVIQANGNPVKVDELEGAQGIIPENIPGLYVTIEELRGGFALMFWAE